MPDEYFTNSPVPPARPARTSGRALLAMAALGVLLGGATVGWLAFDGKLRWDGALGDRTPAVSAAAPAQLANNPAPTSTPTTSGTLPPALAATTTGFEQRLAMMETRLTTLDLKAQAASGNAARAEGLLIALAARRAIERGLPLGYLEEQLKLRFASAQPLAVDTVIAAAKQPVTLDRLAGDLDALGGALADRPANESAWDGFTRQLSGLFVVRRETSAGARPAQRLDHAKLLLRTGQVEAAIAEVSQLPGAGDAAVWISAARRYAGAQRALDLMETAAILEPRSLQDSAGQSIQQPSPAAGPVTTPVVSTAAASSATADESTF